MTLQQQLAVAAAATDQKAKLELYKNAVQLVSTSPVEASYAFLDHSEYPTVSLASFCHSGISQQHGAQTWLTITVPVLQCFLMRSHWLSADNCWSFSPKKLTDYPRICTNLQPHSELRLPRLLGSSLVPATFMMNMQSLIVLTRHACA